MNYAFHPEARLEYLEAIAFFNQREPRFGSKFTIEVEQAIERILEAPDRWFLLEEDVRRCLTHLFSYGILYTIESNHILIVAVMHCSRKPGYWKDRLK